MQIHLFTERKPAGMEVVFQHIAFFHNTWRAIL